jgi:3-hydroxy-3-methylglutaryl CoA synthase
MWFGDGAASFLVGDTDVIAEFKGSYTVSDDFRRPLPRRTPSLRLHTGKNAGYAMKGYSKIIPKAVNGLFDKLNITIDDVDKLVFPCFFKAEHKKIAKTLGAGDKAVDNLHEACGETGCAHPLLMMAKALDAAKPGDRIVLAGFGQGCNAMYFPGHGKHRKGQCPHAVQSTPRKQGSH